MSTVTKSLADPLADEALRHFQKSSQACDVRVQRRAYRLMQASTTKACRAALKEYREAIAPHALLMSSALGNGHMGVVSLLPRVVEGDHGDDDLRIEHEFTGFDAQGRLQLANKVVLDITHHAVSRLFQRINTLDIATVRAALVMPSLMAYAFTLAADEIRQFVLPVRLPGLDGVLVGNVVRREDGVRRLLASTFIRVGPEEDSRHARAYDCVLALWTEGIRYVGSDEYRKKLHRSLEDSPEKNLTKVFLLTPDLLAVVISDAVLRNPDLAWLFDPYEPRPDPVGGVWSAARRLQ